MNIKGLFVWTLGSVIQLISILKKLFVSYLSIAWIMTRWIQGNNRILTITWITGITRFLFISCLDQFCLYFPNPVSMGLRADTKDKNPKPVYVIKRTSSLWMAVLISYSMAWSVGWPKFICLAINFSYYLNQGISDPFFQTNSP